MDQKARVYELNRIATHQHTGFSAVFGKRRTLGGRMGTASR
jgi:hypothetical protein